MKQLLTNAWDFAGELERWIYRLHRLNRRRRFQRRMKRHRAKLWQASNALRIK